MDVFLSSNERSELQRMYQKWIDHLKPAEIEASLVQEGILSERERQEFQAQATNYGRSEHLFSNCLMRATYPQIQKIREMLIETDQHALATLLPLRRGNPYPRRDDVNWDRDTTGPAANDDRSTYLPPPAQNSRPTNPSLRAPNMRPPPAFAAPQPGYPNRRHDQAPPNQGSQFTGGRLHQETSAPHAGQIPPGVSEYRQPTPMSAPRANPPQSQNSQPQNQQAPQNNPSNTGAVLRSNLGWYPTRDGSPIGKGLCLILANFTNKYIGYETDVEEIRKFFQERLQYTVKISRNILVNRMNNIISTTLRDLNGNQLYDRFVMFVLGEGKEDVISGCNPSGDAAEVDGFQAVQGLKMEDIVKMFTHKEGHLPQMRSLPKVFFFQNCTDTPAPRPDGMSQPAGGPQVTYDGLARSAANTDKLTVGADIFVCKAEQPGYMVREQPSWMIQHLMDIFNQYHKHEHFVDMITQLNFELARRAAAGSGQTIEMNQLLKTSHNLTEKFYFVNP